MRLREFEGNVVGAEICASIGDGSSRLIGGNACNRLSGWSRYSCGRQIIDDPYFESFVMLVVSLPSLHGISTTLDLKRLSKRLE